MFLGQMTTDWFIQILFTEKQKKMMMCLLSIICPPLYNTVFCRTTFFLNRNIQLRPKVQGSYHNSVDTKEVIVLEDILNLEI